MKALRSIAILVIFLLSISVLIGNTGSAGPDQADAGPDHPMLMPPQDPGMTGLEPIHPLPGPGSTSRNGRASSTEKVVVIPIEFQDVVHNPGHDMDDLNNRTFSLEPGFRSMNNYFNEVSRGRLNLTGDVGPWVQSAYNMSEYGDDGPGTYPDDANGPVWRLVVEAIQLVDPFVDFSEYDTDLDGQVDHLIVVHAGQGQEALGGSETDIWSHHWAVGELVMADGVRVFGYSMVSEHSPVGTWAHEFGHELGLPDLYDIDGSSWGIGKWGLMGAGSWNGGGNYPAHLCAWSKVTLGWVDPIDILSPMANMTVRQVETGGNIYRLWVGDPDLSTEYFLLENRQKVGFDKKLPGEGLLIWHVDEGQTSNTDDHHRLVDLEEADEENSGDLPIHSGDPWADNKLGFNQFSIPSSNGYNGMSSGWSVKDIGPSEENMTITIDIIADDVGVPFILFKRYVGEKEPVDITAYIFNYGVNDQKDVQVDIIISQGSKVVDTVTKTISSIQSKDSKTVSATFTPEVQGNYLITVRALLEKDQIPENDEATEVLHVTSIIFFDDVESGSNGWDTYSNRAPSDLWNIIDDVGDPTQSHSPSHSWFCGVEQVGGGVYVPFTEYYLERTIDLQQAREGFLIFSHRYDLAFSVQNQSVFRSDTAYLEIKTNLDSFYTELDSYDGVSGGWGTRIYKISSYIENPLVVNMTLRFRLDTELLRYSKGWWVDDILVVGQWFEHDIALLLDEDMISVGPGEMRSIGVTIWNSGSVQDTYYLSATAPPFWNATLPGNEIQVPPLKCKKMTLTIKAHSKAVSGDEIGIVLGATSKGDSSVSREATLLVIVKRTYGLEVDTGPDLVLLPGHQEVVSFNVTNEGNAKETVHFNMTGSAAGWANVSVQTVDIGAFETKRLEIIFDVPLRSIAGDMADLKLRAYTTSGVEDKGTFTIKFGRVYGLELVHVLHDISATPGEETTLQFEIINLGNDKDTVELTYTLPPEWSVDGDNRIVLGGWENVTVSVLVEVSETSPLSDFKVRVRADSSDGETYEEIELKVNVVLPDPAVTSIKLSKTYVTGKQNLTITVIVENKGTGTARDILVAFFDNAKNFNTTLIEELESGDSVEIVVYRKFGNGLHDVAAVISYEGAQGDVTNDEAHENLKVKDQPAFIPGPGMTLFILAMVVAGVISYKRRGAW